jgi:hypothetical protein
MARPTYLEEPLGVKPHGTIRMVVDCAREAGQAIAASALARKGRKVRTPQGRVMANDHPR